MIHEATKDCPRTLESDRVLTVYVHKDAQMDVPKNDWLWQLRYQDEPDRCPTICNDRMIAAGVGETLRYLVMECTKDEAWHRIKQMRKAVLTHEYRAVAPTTDGAVLK